MGEGETYRPRQAQRVRPTASVRGAVVNRVVREDLSTLVWSAGCPRRAVIRRAVAVPEGRWTSSGLVSVSTSGFADGRIGLRHPFVARFTWSKTAHR